MQYRQCVPKKSRRPESKSENAPNFESHKETREGESIKKLELLEFVL